MISIYFFITSQIRIDDTTRNFKRLSIDNVSVIFLVSTHIISIEIYVLKWKYNTEVLYIT